MGLTSPALGEVPAFTGEACDYIGHVELSERSLGWLRTLHRNAHRFDLVDSSYAMGLMAHRTPAWTEPYVAILDQLIERHTRWWSANRVEPWGVQTDPVAADELPFDEGSFLVLLGIRSMIAGGDDRWNQPFETIGGGDDAFTWTHSEIAEQLCRQWLAAPIGCHREDAGVWPSRLVRAGLGLKLHDDRHGTDYHQRAVEPWWRYAREHYFDLAGDAVPETTTLFYAPMLDVHHRLPVAAALTTSFYAAPQEPDDALRLFEAGVADMGLDRESPTPLRPSRAIGSSWVLAREWELDDLADRLGDAIDASCEPTWDTVRGEFTWALGSGEPRRRGQFDAFLAAGEAAGPGMWTRLSAAPLDPCPQIVGVDFPAMAFTRAEWVDGNLRLRLAPLRDDPTKRTGFRIVGAEPRNWDVHGMDGVSLDLSTTGLDVRVPLIAGDLELIRSSY